MLAKRIIPCLDVKDGKVVKGVCFQNHQVVGNIIELAQHYNHCGADELVFYDITASCENRTVSENWVLHVAKSLDIPFCVAGGIKTLNDANRVLNSGADKISINTPAIEDPALIDKLANRFGTQCIVIGIDSLKADGKYRVCRYTGDARKMLITNIDTQQWIQEVQSRGAGEIVLNCMNQDGMRQGYDIEQLKLMRKITNIPLIASGGAGTTQHFLDAFSQAKVDGALAASVFHKKTININNLKKFLFSNEIQVRI